MIEFFAGTGGVTINIEDPVELHQVLNILLNQINSNMPESNIKDLSPIIEEALKKIEQTGYNFDV